MTSDAIVKTINEEEYIRNSILMGLMKNMIHQLHFRCPGKTLYKSIFVTIGAIIDGIYGGEIIYNYRRS